MTRTATLSHTEIARHAARGRQLQARAVRGALRAAARWAVHLAVGVFGRRRAARSVFAGPAGSGRAEGGCSVAA